MHSTPNAELPGAKIVLQPKHPTSAGVLRSSSLHTLLKANLGLLLLVVLPTLLAAIYFFFIAASRYEAESKFIIRSPSNVIASQLANLVQGSSIVRSSDDAYIVHAYIESRDILLKLVDKVQLIERLGRPEVDFFWRYPRPFKTHTLEQLHSHMKWLVSVDYENSTGITTLRVDAFRPEDARAILDAMLELSEDLVNRLSERALGDAVQSALGDVERSKSIAIAARENITQFRTKNGLIDPGRVSSSALDTIARLALDAARARAQLSEIEASSPQSAQAAVAARKIEALDAQIGDERLKLAGAEESLAPLLAEYEKLTLERGLAEQAYASALTSLEAARLEGQRQRLFLERIANATSSDYAKYPYRLINTMIVFAVCWMLYSIGRRLIADASQHAEI